MTLCLSFKVRAVTCLNHKYYFMWKGCEILAAHICLSNRMRVPKWSCSWKSDHQLYTKLPEGGGGGNRRSGGVVVLWGLGWGVYPTIFQIKRPLFMRNISFYDYRQNSCKALRRKTLAM